MRNWTCPTLLRYIISDFFSSLLEALFVVFAKHDIEQVPRSDDAGALPSWRKVLEIARYQIFGTRGLRTFEKHVVVRVRAYVQARGWTDPKPLSRIARSALAMIS